MNKHTPEQINRWLGYVAQGKEHKEAIYNLMGEGYGTSFAGVIWARAKKAYELIHKSKKGLLPEEAWQMVATERWERIKK